VATTCYNLGQLSWTLTGWSPFEWQLERSGDVAESESAPIPALPAQVPGSVQQALLNTGLIPDWTVGLNASACEWVENRHWVFTTHLPSEWLEGTEDRDRVILRAEGLDHAGWIFCNGQEVATFADAFVPQVVDLTPWLRRHAHAENVLHIIFACPPRWLGQFGATSQMTEWKPRFNYTWDWLPRLVQIGIWDDLLLCVVASSGLDAIQWTTAVTHHDGVAAGSLHLQGVVCGTPDGRLRMTLADARAPEAIIRQAVYDARSLRGGIEWTDLPIDLWWPNGAGEQPLYLASVDLLDQAGHVIETRAQRVGFKSVRWEPCLRAPEQATPWLCVVNGRPIFLQGVNWTPIRPNFADVGDEDYRQRLTLYREMGCNVLRVWGGAYLEKRCFYDLCDAFGLLVWQEFPLSSSGVENWPPADAPSIETLCQIAASYIERRRHHVSLLLWCGGNELQAVPGDGYPLTEETAPAIAALAQVVATMDPGRRFVPTSPSGPRFERHIEETGKHVHWDVHGPWVAHGALDEEWTRYWHTDDALFRSEVGAPGASSAKLIRTYAGGAPPFPADDENALWRRTSWWIEWEQYLAEHSRAPSHLDDYVQWSQERQAAALAIAARACKDRFPQCGGFIVWMGHDAFPVTANTSILDFDGQMKVAASRLATIFREATRALCP
jgi:beta-mannosidase